MWVLLNSTNNQNMHQMNQKQYKKQNNHQIQ